MLTIQQEIQRIFLKEKRICELDSFLSQAARWYVCERTPYSAVHWTKPLTTSLPLGTLAESYQKQIRAHSGKCALTTTTHHAQAAGETASMHEDGSKSSSCSELGLFGYGSKRTSLVQPETLLRWHREFFRLYWKRRSKAYSHKPKVAAETIALIREMATENRLWGAERIRGSS